MSDRLTGIPFSKLAGTGNDFIVVDNRNALVAEDDKGPLAMAICDRRRSVGADGLLFLERSEAADFTMRLFNPDGHEGEMCGNGARCIAFYAFEAGIAPAEMRIETTAGIVRGRVRGNGVRLRLWRLDKITSELREIEVSGRTLEVHYLEVGVPHGVVFENNVHQVDGGTIQRLGREVRLHQAFPRGVNVNFVEVRGLRDLNIRTYERGVEDETLACGTGCVAASLVAHQVFGVESPVRLLTRGGALEVAFEEGASGWDIYLEGEVHHIMEGRILPQAWEWKGGGAARGG